MGVIKNEDIIGYALETETVCLECIEASEAKAALENQLILNDSSNADWLEEHTLFCDRCKKQISC